MKKTIPLHRPTITKKDLISVLNCLVDEQISDQTLTGDFEKKFNQLIKAKNNLVAVDHVANALYLIFKHIGIQPDDEIILSPLADYFVGEVIQLFGAKPIWVDLEMGNLKMNVDEIRAKLGEKTKAIIISHHFGYPFDLKALEDFHLSEKKIVLIEDNTSSLGSKRMMEENEGRQEWVGMKGDYGFFCFAAKRMLTTGSGAMIYTQSKNDAKQIRAMRSWHEPTFTATTTEEPTLERPMNDRLDFSLNDIHAAMGISEIALFEKFVKRRQEIRKYFSDVLMKTTHSFIAENDWELNGYAFPVIFSSGIATAKEMFGRAKIQVAGLEEGTIYEKMDYLEELKVINELKLRFLQIPIYPTLKIEEIDHISKILASIT